MGKPLSVRGLILGASILLAVATPANAVVTLNFAAYPGSSVSFDGSTDSFQLKDLSSPPGFQWWITSVTGGTEDSLAKYGFIKPKDSSISWFSWGNITKDGTKEYAKVNTPGLLNISDGSKTLTADVDWIQIHTDGAQGGLNLNAEVNLSNIKYDGTLSDLLAFKAVNSGIVNLTFQFASITSLTALSEDTAKTTGASYSGTITAVPEPTTILAGALLLLPFGASAIRLISKKR